MEFFFWQLFSAEGKKKYEPSIAQNVHKKLVKNKRRQNELSKIKYPQRVPFGHCPLVIFRSGSSFIIYFVHTIHTLHAYIHTYYVHICCKLYIESLLLSIIVQSSTINLNYTSITHVYRSCGWSSLLSYVFNSPGFIESGKPIWNLWVKV